MLVPFWEMRDFSFVVLGSVGSVCFLAGLLASDLKKSEPKDSTLASVPVHTAENEPLKNLEVLKFNIQSPP